MRRPTKNTLPSSQCLFLLFYLLSSAAPRGEKTKQRYGEGGGAKITLHRAITVVKPCCHLMCCDNGDKERLRIDPSEWAAEERELCVTNP